MKLPEHYEKWIDDIYPSRTFYYPNRQGAMEMYHKLMADLAPAIEALKLCASPYSSEHKENEAKKALAQLKEKGLVE